MIEDVSLLIADEHENELYVAVLRALLQSQRMVNVSEYEKAIRSKDHSAAMRALNINSLEENLRHG